MKSSRAALAAFQDAGGFTRMTELLQWTALTFAGTEFAGADGQRRESPGQDGGDPSSSAALRSSGVTSTSAPGTIPARWKMLPDVCKAVSLAVSVCLACCLLRQSLTVCLYAMPCQAEIAGVLQAGALPGCVTCASVL